jgi:anti-sigma factor RsiW
MAQVEVRCVEFVEQITEWSEGGLGDEERLLFEEHLAFCSPCSRYVEQLRRSLELVRAGEEALGEAPPPSLRAALLQAFRQQRS